MASSLLQSLQACLLSGALGDAMGGAVEGANQPNTIAATHWRLSDDTQLTLATCRAIVSAGGVDPEAIAAEFLADFRARRLRGLGASTLGALRALDVGGHWALSGSSGERAGGNGCAMRIAPLAFCLDLRSADDRRTLREVCSITHKHDEAYSGALAVALAVQEGLREEALGATLLRCVAEQLPDTSTRDALLELDRLEVDAPIARAATQCGTSGYAAESVPLALFAARRAQRLAVPEALAEVVAVGGDTDTIASMAGQVAGAALGEKALPEDWAKKVPERESVLRTAKALSEVLLGS